MQVHEKCQPVTVNIFYIENAIKVKRERRGHAKTTWFTVREKCLGKVGRMETVRSSILPKDITDRERSNSAGKSDSAGNRAWPRRANISWIKETKHHMNRKTNRTKLLETKTGLRVNKVAVCIVYCVLYLYLFNWSRQVNRHSLLKKKKKEKKKKIKTPLVTLYRYRFPVSGQPRHTL